MVDESVTETLGAPGRGHGDLVSSDEGMLQKIVMEKMYDTLVGDHGRVQDLRIIFSIRRNKGIKLLIQSHRHIY